MSASVDERIVQMRFNNQEFEARVKQTLDTMEKLRSSMDFTGAAKGFDQISKAADSVKLDSMMTSLQKIEKQFSVLGIAGMTAINNLVNSAVNAGKRMAEELTIKPVTQGLNEYELKMGSVQTIMASTGETLQTVNTYLDELNHYADRTIYSFSDMTRNIGKFTNAGVKLEDAVAAIQGISNEAAVSGANANEASRAMYNFAQALSAGYVKLIDWKSIENANMATVEFKNELIDTALQLGTIVKQGDMYVSTTKDMQGKVSDAFTATRNFNDSLSAQWMTTDVLVQTLKRYTDETTELGKKAFAAAQDVKTFTQLMDTLKEAAGSGWATTWEIIFGDFNEAKELWTNVSQVVGGFIDLMSSARNDMLRGGLATGWKNFTAMGIKDAEGLKETIQEVATEEGVQVDRMIKKYGSFEKSLKSGWLTADILGKALENTGKKLVGLSDEELANIGYTREESNAFFEFYNSLMQGDKSLEEIAAEIGRVSGRENLIEGLANVFKLLGQVIKPIGVAISEIFPAPTVEQIYNMTVSFRNFTESLLLSNEAMYTLKVAAKTVVLPIKALVDLIEVGAYVVAIIALQLWKLGDTLLSLPAKVSSVTGAMESLFGSERFSRLATAFSQIIANLGEAFAYILEQANAAFTSLKNSEAVTKAMEALGKALEYVKEHGLDLVVAGFEKLASLDFKKTPELFKAGFEGLIDLFKRIGEAVKGFFSLFEFDDPPEGMQVAQASIQKVSAAVTTAAPMVDEFTTTFDDFGKIVKKAFNTVTEAIGPFLGKLTAGKVLVFAFGVSMIRVVNSGLTLIDGLGSAAKGFGKMAEAFGGGFLRMTTSASNLIDTLNTKLKPNTTATIITNIKSIAIAFAILTASVVALSNIEQQNLIQAGIAIGAIAAGLIIFLGLLSSMAKTASKVPGMNTNLLSLTVAIIAIAGAMAILAVSFGLLSKVDTTNIVDQLVYFAAMLTFMVMGLSVLSKYAPELSKGAFTIIAFALGLGTLIKSIQTLAGSDLSGVTDNVVALGLIVAMLVSLSVLAGQLNFGSAAAMTVLVLDILLFLGVVKKLENYSLGSLVLGVVKLMPIVLALDLLMEVIDGTEGHAVGAGIAILAISVALNLLASAITTIGALDLGTIAKGGLAVAALLLIFNTTIKATEKAGAHAAQAGIAIMLFAGAMLALQFVVKYLGGIDLPTLAKGTVALGYLMLVFGIATAIAGQAKNAIGPIAVMTLAVGVLTAGLMLLTLLPTDELLLASISLSAVLLSMAVVLKNLSGLKMGDVMKNAIALGSILGITTAALVVLTMCDLNDVFLATLSLDSIMLIFALVTKIMKSIDWATVAQSAVLMGAFMAEITIALIALNGLDAGTMIASAASLGVMLVAIGASTHLIAKTQWQTMIGSAVAMGLFLAEIVLALNALRDWDPTQLLQTTVALGAIMLAMSAVVAIMGAIGSLTGASGMIGGAVFDVVMAELTALIAGFGALTKIDGFEDLLNNGARVFQEIGNALGSFVGGILGGIANGAMQGISAGLGSIGSALSQFGIDILPFITSMKFVDEGVITAATSIAGMIMQLTKAELLDAVTSFIGGGEKNFASFAAEMNQFAPLFVEFSKTISEGNIDGETVKAAASAAETMATLANKLPSTGGKIQEWFGEKDLGKFGQRLAAFGLSFAVYYQAITSQGDIDFQKVEDSARAAQMLADMNSSLPSTGGKIQEWFGEKNLGTFGGQLKSFAEGIVSYYQVLSEGNVDFDVIQKSAQAASFLADLQNQLPSTGGMIAEWFTGSKINLSTFGDQIEDFADSMVGYYKAIAKAKFEDDILDKSTTAAKAVASLNNELPETGGLKGLIFGDQDMSSFSKSLTAFGEAIASFYESISGVNIDAQSPADLMKGLGEDLDQALADGITEGASEVTAAGKSMLSGVTSGVDSTKETLYNKMQSIAKIALQRFKNHIGVTSSNSSTKFAEIGRAVVQGFIDGVEGNKTTAISTMRDLATDLVDTMKEGLDENSPSKKFNEIGKFLVQGLNQGVEKTTPEALDGMVQFSKSLLETTQKWWGINSPSLVAEKEVGHYIVTGIAEGITKDMTAEQAARQKSLNIVKAFQAGIDASGTAKEIENLQHKIWGFLNPEPGDGASQEESDTYVQKNYEESLRNLEALVKIQADNVVKAKEAYDEVVKNTPNDTEALDEANKLYLQQYSDYLDIISQIRDLNETQKKTVQDKLDANQQARKAYNKLFNSDEEKEFRDQWIHTEEEYDSYVKFLQKQVGYNPELDSTLQASDFMTDMSSLIDKYASNLELHITYATESAVNNGTLDPSAYTNGVGNIGKGLEQALANGGTDDISNVLTKGLSDALNGANFKGTGAQMLEGLVDGVSGGISALKNKAIDAAKSYIGGWDQETQTNSPSKVMYDRGVYLIEGLTNGINDTAPIAGQAMTNLFGILISNSTLSGQELVDSFMQGFANASVTGDETLQNALNEVILRLQENLDIYRQGGWSVGDQIASGMLDAINNGLPSIISAAQNAAEQAYQAAMAKLNGENFSMSLAATSTNKAYGVAMNGGSKGTLSASTTSAMASQLATIKAAANEMKQSSQSGSGGNTVINNNFTQNNTSPKALSRTEIYRDTKNLLSQTKGATQV